jgi:hypothetical protein
MGEAPRVDGGALPSRLVAGPGATRSALRSVRKARARWIHRALAIGAADGVARLTGHQLVTVLGDSHAKVFRELHHGHVVPRTWFHVVVVPGATALGIANPNSKTDARKRYRAALRRVPAERRTLVMLGEVDADFLVWLRAETNGTTVEHELEVSLLRYQGFLTELQAAGRRRLGIISVVPPTIEDYTAWAGLNNARRSVSAGIAERTALTRTYNARMRAWAADHGCAFLDLDLAAIDNDTGLVRDGLRNSDPSNHHLDRPAFVALLRHELAGLDWSVCDPVPT